MTVYAHDSRLDPVKPFGRGLTPTLRPFIDTSLNIAGLQATKALRPLVDDKEKAGRKARARPAGLSPTLREALLGRKLVSTARVLDGLKAAGKQPGDAFTAKDLIAAGFSRPTAYRLTAKMVEELNSLNSSGVNDLSCMYPRELRLIQDKSRRGPKATAYEMPSDVELAKLLGVPTRRLEPAEAPPASVMQSARQYRIAAYRAFVKRQPGRYSRKALGERLGVKGSTTRGYDEEAGVEAIERLSKPEALTQANLDGFKARDMPWRLYDTVGRLYPATRDGLQRALAASETHSGQAVAYLRRRLTNYYRLADVQAESLVATFTDTLRRVVANGPVKSGYTVSERSIKAMTTTKADRIRAARVLAINGSVTAAATAARVHRNTIHRWLARADGKFQRMVDAERSRISDRYRDMYKRHALESGNTDHAVLTVAYVMEARHKTPAQQQAEIDDMLAEMASEVDSIVAQLRAEQVLSGG